MLLVVVLAVLSSLGAAQPCDLYVYGAQPGPAGSDAENCSLEGASVELHCQVLGVGNVELRWYKTSNKQQAGTTFDSLLVDRRDGFLVEKEIQSTTSRYSTLNVTLLGAEFYGYYWCAVYDQTSNQHLRNPSQVLNIQPCNGAPPCSSTTTIELRALSATRRCPDSRFDVTIIPAQQCPTQPAATAATKATTMASPTVPVNSTQPPNTDDFTQLSTTELVTMGNATEKASSEPPSPHTSAATTGEVPPSASSVIWLSVGVSVAVMLAAIASIIALIMCIQFRRVRRKGPVAVPQQSAANTGTINGRYIVTPDLRAGLFDQEHEYAEIPAHYRDKGIRNPSFDKHPSLPSNSKNRGYENVNMGTELQAVPNAQRYELVTRDDTEDYSHLQHSSSSSNSSSGGSEKSNSPPINRSLTATRLPLPKPPIDTPVPLQAPPTVFDDHNYSDADEIAAKLSQREGPAVLPPRGGAPEDYYEKPLQFAPKKGFVGKEAEELSAGLDCQRRAEAKHAYTPIELKQQPRPHNYSHAIRSLEDSYVSEKGHVYQVLEDSLKIKDSLMTNGTGLPSSLDQPMYHVLETSPTKFESDGPVYHVLERSESPHHQAEVEGTSTAA